MPCIKEDVMSRFQVILRESTIGLIVFAAWLSPSGQAQNFKPVCGNPHLPSTKATLMDQSKCGAEGIGDAAETQQNEAKNNFCPRSQKAAAIDFKQLAALQKEV